MLHWLIYFSYLLLAVLLSFIFYQRSLLQLIFLSEVALVILFIIFIFLGLLKNIYYSFGVALFLLICGGLELTLNLILLVL